MTPAYTETREVTFKNLDEGYEAELTLDCRVYPGDPGCIGGPPDSWVQPTGPEVDIDVRVNSLTRANYGEDGKIEEIIRHQYDNDAERADADSLLAPIIQDFESSIRYIRLTEYLANQA